MKYLFSLARSISPFSFFAKNHRNLFVQYGMKLIRSPYSITNIIKRFYTDKKYRDLILLRLRHPFNLQQFSNYTLMDRYPLIFSACRDYLGDNRKLKILSYGCSTGEEVLTLRKYFPNAFILGAEINPAALAKCREIEADDRLTFIHSSTKAIEQHGPFDAIFCMAVLQRTPHKVINENITNLKNIYPFSKFETQVGKLDRCLNKSGIMVIHHTQYMLTDTSIGSHYELLEDAEQEVEFVPRFDKNSNRIERDFSGRSIFIKKTS